MPVPSSLALTNIADGATIVAADHRNNYTAIQSAVNAIIGFLGSGVTGDLLAFDGVNWLHHAAISYSNPSFTDSGQTDLTLNQGLYLIEVAQISNGATIGTALVSGGASTASTNVHLAVLASAVNPAGVVPTFTIVGNDTPTAVLRVATTAATGLTVNVRVRRITKSI